MARIHTKKKDFFKNIVTGFGGQFIVIILGVIIPRIMIISYGSDVNGLVTTTAQIFAYLALLEAGIGQSARVALYRPLADNDEMEVLKVYASAEGYFRKITLFYGIGVVVLSLVTPLVIKSDVDYVTILLVVLFEGLSGVISFFFIQTPTILLNADGKGYINNYITLANKVFAYAAKIVLATCGVSIVILQLAYFIITVVKVIIYRRYLRKQYSWLNKKTDIDYTLLKDKNSYLLTEVAWAIFSSTDMIVLSMFISTKLSSVYSVYNLIYSNINLLLVSIGGSVLYVLGQIYHRGIEEYAKVHDAFNTLFVSSITVLMSVSYLLTIPFIKLYTKGVTDIDYIYSELPLLFSLVQLLSWSRYVTGNLTGLAGYAKKTSYISMIEAIINLGLSILLVPRFGIVGVLVATVIALPIKVIWCAYISDRKVLNRSFLKSLIIYGVNYFLFFIICVISMFINLDINSYGRFAGVGIVLITVIAFVVFGINFLINRECVRVVKRYLGKR